MAGIADSALLCVFPSYALQGTRGAREPIRQCRYRSVYRQSDGRRQVRASQWQCLNITLSSASPRVSLKLSNGIEMLPNREEASQTNSYLFGRPLVEENALGMKTSFGHLIGGARNRRAVTGGPDLKASQAYPLRFGFRVATAWHTHRGTHPFRYYRTETKTRDCGTVRALQTGISDFEK
jgi:hypothetical protein